VLASAPPICVEALFLIDHSIIENGLVESLGE